MKIAFVVERPTQFEAPFYRHAAADPGHHLRVLYTDPLVGGSTFDPEMKRHVSWGFDLLEGYDHAVLPAQGRVRWLAAELRRERYDLVIVNGYTQRAYLTAAALARRAGIPTGLRIDSVLSGKPRRERAKRLLFSTGLMRLYRLFFGVGTLTLEYLRFFGVPEERTALFPYAIDVEGFRRRSALSPDQRAQVRAKLGIPAEARLLLSVAKLHPREAPWDLLRAFARRSDPDLWLVIAGDGPLRRELETFVRARGLQRVLFIGYTAYPQLPHLYAAADLFVHAAREERWGVSVQEALACGLPVVASSRVGAGYDLIEIGGNGFVYVAGDDEELALRIGAALALAPERVIERSRDVLARWDYDASWRNLLEAASRVDRERL